MCWHVHIPWHTYVEVRGQFAEFGSLLLPVAPGDWTQVVECGLLVSAFSHGAILLVLNFPFWYAVTSSSDLVFLENKRIFKHFTELKKIQYEMISLIWIKWIFLLVLCISVSAQADSKIKSPWHDVERRKINYLFSLIGIWKNLQTSYELIFTDTAVWGQIFIADAF